MVAIVDLERGIPSKRESSTRADYVPAFVHTARRYYRLTGLARTLDWGPGGRQRLAGILREAVPTWSVRGSKSRNKVSVGEPAEGSLLFPFRLFAFHLLTSVSERLCAPSGCARWLTVHNLFSFHFRSCLSVNVLGKKSTKVGDRKKPPKKQLPTVDPLACTSMKTVAKCDIVLRIAEFSESWNC